MGDEIAAILFCIVCIYLAIRIYLRNTAENRIKRHQYCRFCGKVMEIKHTYNGDGKMNTFLRCSVAPYEDKFENMRRHDLIFLRENRVVENYDPTTGYPKNRGKNDV